MRINMLLENKIAIIRGGGRSIGQSIAMLYGRNGVKIILIARTTKQIENVAEELHQIECECIAVTADIIR